MKYILIAAIALLALAQGNQAQDAIDAQRFTKFLEDMHAQITSQASDMINNQDFANKAKEFVRQGGEQLEPLATQLQERLKSWASNLEDQATQVQAQYQPLLENFKTQVEEAIQKLSAPAIEN